LLLGVGLGVALLLPGAWLRAVGYHTLGEAQPPGLLAAWVPAVLLVATAEEVALRGALQPMLRAQLGPAPAIALTAVVFSLMHLALYGAAALWLDLGVGLLLGCLREYTGGVAPCALAHAIADLGAWWLP
jgi:membrane protease YdiL (CAAX protease family)